MSTAPSDVILTRMMSLHPKIIDLTLDRVWRLLDALGHPERRLPPVVHIAGTNGKGSSLAMLRAGLEAAGDRVHVYTSPHLGRFHERIRVAGALISEPDLTHRLDECLRANGGDPITYFEITTAAALLAFARAPADWTLLETGLGGRLDATNVVDRPRLTMLAPIALDHQQYLGGTLEKIASEKAGILKRGVPCIVGPQPEEAGGVIEDRAAQLGVPCLVHGQHWHVAEDRGRLIFQDETGLLDLPLPPLPGIHQVENAGLALAALRHLGCDERACEAAMRDAVWPARMQRLARGPLIAAARGAPIWLDGGHNPAAGAALSATFRQMPGPPLHLICGMLKTKDVAGYLTQFAGLAASLHAVAIAGEAATLSARETARAGRTAGLTARTADSVETAVRDIVDDDENVRILICGSLYLAGRVLRDNG